MQLKSVVNKAKILKIKVQTGHKIIAGCNFAGTSLTNTEDRGAEKCVSYV